MRTADHARIDYAGVKEQHRLDLVRVDVRAAPDDDVLHPPDDVQVSLAIDKPQVAHVRPSVARIGPSRLSPVAVLDQLASHADLISFDLPLAPTVRPSHRRPPLLLRLTPPPPPPPAPPPPPPPPP